MKKIVKRRIKINEEEETEQYWPFDKGGTEIWYAKPEAFRDLIMGYNFCKKQGCLPDISDLGKSHVKLGTVNTTDINKIFSNFQGDSWSPNGEARNLIKSKGLSHTSMSVGDVVKVSGKVYIVDNFGFKELHKEDALKEEGIIRQYVKKIINEAIINKE